MTDREKALIKAAYNLIHFDALFIATDESSNEAQTDADDTWNTFVVALKAYPEAAEIAGG